MTLGSSITAVRSLTGPGGGFSDGGCLPVAIGMTGLPAVLLFLVDLDAGIADGEIDRREREVLSEDVGDGPVSGCRPRQRSPARRRGSFPARPGSYPAGASALYGTDPPAEGGAGAWAMDSRNPMTITCGEDRGAFGALARTGEANTLAGPDRTFRPDRPQLGRLPFDRAAVGLDRWVRPGRGRPPYRRHGPGAQRPPRHHPSTRQGIPAPMKVSRWPRGNRNWPALIETTEDG